MCMNLVMADVESGIPPTARPLKWISTIGTAWLSVMIVAGEIWLSVWMIKMDDMLGATRPDEVVQLLTQGVRDSRPRPERWCSVFLEEEYVAGQWRVNFPLVAKCTLSYSPLINPTINLLGRYLSNVQPSGPALFVRCWFWGEGSNASPFLC